MNKAFAKLLQWRCFVRVPEFSLAAIYFFDYTAGLLCVGRFSAYKAQYGLAGVPAHGKSDFWRGVRVA